MIKLPAFFVELQFKKGLEGRTDVWSAEIRLPSRKWSWRVGLQHHSAIKKLSEIIKKIPFSLEIATEIHAIGGDPFFSLDLKILALKLIVNGLMSVPNENVEPSEVTSEKFKTTEELEQLVDPEERTSLKNSILDLTRQLTELKSLNLHQHRDEYELRAMSFVLLLTDFYLATIIYLEFLYPVWNDALKQETQHPSELFQSSWELAMFDLERSKDIIKDEMVEAFSNL